LSFNAFEHKLAGHLKTLNTPSKYSVACSGGLDSAVLLHSMCRVKPLFDFELEVVHVHHGGSLSAVVQSEYRDKAMFFVEHLAASKNLSLITEKSNVFLQSEESCRDFRKKVFEVCSPVLTAHHKDDFLETLIMRMIRGSGPQGLIQPFENQGLKPFLHLFRRDEIKSYALEKKIEWLEDPSNGETDPLRNWVRKNWLPSLDEKIGKSGFVKSMELISSALESQNSDDILKSVEFDHELGGFFSQEAWHCLNRFQKQSIIAHILLKVRKSGYTQGQIEEVVKQLSQNTKNITFRSGKIVWVKSESKVEFRLES